MLPLRLGLKGYGLPHKFLVRLIFFISQKLLTTPTLLDYVNHRMVYQDFFGPFPSSVGVILVAPEESDVLGGRMNCGPFLSEAFELQEQILSLGNRTFEKLCLRPLGGTSPCLFFSPLQYWPEKLAGCNADVNKHITVSQNFHHTPLGVPLGASLVFGGLRFQGKALVRANAASMTFFLADSESDEAIAWMRALIKLVEGWKTTKVRIPLAVGAFEVVAASTPVSLADASMVSIGSQWWLPLFAVGMTVSVMFIALGCIAGVYGVLVGLAGFVLVCFSVGCSLGATSLLMPTNAVTIQVAAILVLAVSVDITFVFSCMSLPVPVGLAHALPLQSQGGEEEEQEEEEEGANLGKSPLLFNQKRLQRALITVGPSLAFALLMLIVTFTCSAIIGTLAGVNVVITVCIASVITFATQGVCLPSFMILLSRGSLTISPRRRFLPESFSRKCKSCSFNRAYASFVKFTTGNTFLRWIIAVLFVTVGVVSIFPASRVQSGIDSKILAPRGSNDEKFQIYVEKRFGARLSVPWYWVVQSNHFNSSAVQNAVQLQKDALMRDFNISSISSPLSNMISWILFLGRHREEYQRAGNRIPEAKFVPWLREFLAAEGKLHMKDCVFQNDTLVAFRALASVDAPSVMELSQKFRSILEGESSSSGGPGKLQIGFYSWSPMVPVLSQFFHLERNISITVVLSVVLVCFFTAVFFWGQFALPVVLFLCVGLVLLDMFAFMSVVGVSLNGVTSLTIVTGIGLCTEYILQLLQLFSETKDIVSAAEQVGASLILSVLCSCVGMIVIVVFSDSAVVRLYLSALWLCVFVLGAVHAFVLAPVLLSIFSSFQKKTPSVLVPLSSAVCDGQAAEESK